MGEKKRKEAQTARWKQVLVVGACVLFVVLMVVSGMGSSWLTMFSSAKPGDTLVIDYTIYNANATPIVTTEKAVYQKAVANGQYPFVAKQMSVIANKTLAESLNPIEVYTANGQTSQFAMFAPEYNAISAGLVGMKTNQQKTIALPVSSSMTTSWSAAQLASQNVNISSVNVGDLFSMGVGISDNPADVATNASALSYLRVGEISRKTPAGIVVDFGYPNIDVRVVSINSKA
jgi:hypothetical protein